MSPPSITVAIPAYNAAEWIGETIETVLAQTRPADEVIVVDDGSTDGTVAELERFGDALKLIRQENRGCPGAFDTAFRAATADFVALCPADDLWQPRKLEWQAEALAAHPEVDVAFGGAEWFGGREGRYPRPSADGVLEPGSFARELYESNVIADPSAVVRRKLYLRLGGYLPLIGEDYEFWLRALSEGATFYFDPRLVVCLREHGGNLSARALAIWETNHMVHERYAHLVDDGDLVDRALARDLRKIGRCRLGVGDAAAAATAYRRALARGPSFEAIAMALALRVPPVRALARVAVRARASA